MALQGDLDLGQNKGPGNGLLSDGIKPLPETMLKNHKVVSSFKNFIDITPTDASFANVTQGKEYKHTCSLHNNKKRKYTMINNEYCIEISMYLNLIILS